MHPTQPERTARLKEANKKRGLVQMSVWIPKERRQELKDLAEKWREESKWNIHRAN